MCMCSEEHNGYLTLPESDEEQGKRPASSQGDLEAWREQVTITHAYHLFESNTAADRF